MNSNILIGIPIKSLENPMSRLSKSISLAERKDFQINQIKNTENSFRNEFSIFLKNSVESIYFI